MSEDLDELPAVYRMLSDDGLRRLRFNYETRLETAQGDVLKVLLQARITYIDAELARRKS